jgi:hypothetical protein
MIDAMRSIALLGLMKVILLMFPVSLGILLLGSCSTEPGEVEPGKNEPTEPPQPSPSVELNTTVERKIVREAPDFVYPDGPVTIYYDDGTKHSSGLYKDGKKEGNWVYFGTEPEVYIRKEVYKDGEKISEESFE